MVGELGVSLHGDARERLRLLKPGKEHADFHISEMFLCRQCSVDWSVAGKASGNMSISIRKAFGRLDWLSRLPHGHRLSNSLVHVVGPGGIDGRVEEFRLKMAATLVSKMIEQAVKHR